MAAVEASELVSEEDNGALDMAAVTFTEWQAPRPPPRRVQAAFKEHSRSLQAVSPEDWARGRPALGGHEGAFLVRGQRLIPAPQQTEIGANGDDHERSGPALCNPR